MRLQARVTDGVSVRKLYLVVLDCCSALTPDVFVVLAFALHRSQCCGASRVAVQKNKPAAATPPRHDEEAQARIATADQALLTHQASTVVESERPQRAGLWLIVQWASVRCLQVGQLPSSFPSFLPFTPR